MRQLKISLVSISHIIQQNFHFGDDTGLQADRKGRGMRIPLPNSADHIALSFRCMLMQI